MFNNKRLSSISPRVAIVGAFIAIVAISAAALLFTRGGPEAKVEASMQPRAARLERVDGSVGIARADDQVSQPDWTEASINTPVTVGDRIYARDNAHASIALTGRHYVRLNPLTSIDLLSLEEDRTQLALRSGSALFDVGELDSGEFYEVATPCGAVDFKEPGLYQIGMDGNNAIISVLSGLAQVVGQEGSGSISKGQVFTLLGATATQALVSNLAPRVAGNTVDEYYRYRYANRYDGRYRDYDTYLEDPFYYEPYRTSLSSQYLSEADIPGLYDLDYYGDWVDNNDYGRCWAPRVSAGWAPYRSGYWDLDDTWGPSWISSEPWGWAPYHYGRWTNVNQQWLWVPVEVRSRPAYIPATVAFIPLGDEIGWVPLGPREQYVPRYYDNFQPRYLASAEVVRVVTVQNTFVNYNVPGGVTVVPVRGFNRFIDPGDLRTVDSALLVKARPVIDPFAVNGIRELAIRRDDGRRRFKFDRGEQDSLNTAVVASSLPATLAARGNIASQLRVEAVPEKRKANKLRINEATGVTSLRRADGLPQPLEQSQRMAVLTSRAEQGDKAARREMRQLMRADQQGSVQAQASPQQQAQQEQTRQQIKEQRKAERQQQPMAGAQVSATGQTQQQQLKQQRKAERQQQAAQQNVTGQTQQQQLKQQRKAERQQAAQPDAARQIQQQQMKQQRKAERRQAAQPTFAPQVEQQQQLKQQRKAERQQAAQQDAARQSQQRQQTKQERKEQRRPPQASIQPQQQRWAQQQAAQSQVAQQQREQFKAQRRAERQQQAASQAAQASQSQIAQQQREQFKAQRRAERQQQVVSQPAQASQQAQSREQMKAQRRAERQQQVTVAQPQAVPSANPDKAQRKAEKAQRRPPQ